MYYISMKKSGVPTKSTPKHKKPVASKKALTERQEEKEYNRNEKNLKSIIRGKGYKYKKVSKCINETLGKYEPSIKYIKNLVYSGKDIISLRLRENKYEHRYFTLKTVKRLSDELSKKLKENNVNGKMMTSIVYGDLAWKSGYFKDIGSDVRLYDPNDLYNLEVPYPEPKRIPAFNIYVALGPRDVGGNDNNNNDCLYYCLSYYIYNIDDYFEGPEGLKKFLQLKRNDKIPLSCIDKIEKKLKNYQINVRGDYIRSSTVQSNMIIDLILINEHYQYEKIDKNLTKFIKYEEKIPVMWDKKTFESYDGVNKWLMDRYERNNIIYNFHSKYILVNREKQGIDENGNRIIISIEEEYNNFIEMANKLKIETNGLINLYKSGSYHDAGLNLFDKLSKCIHGDDLLQDEAYWIDKSYFSAIIFSNKYEGELYEYDIKSLYPYIASLNKYKFPVKRGEFRIIKEFGEYFEFGIYRCIIDKSEDIKLNNLFRFNIDNYYTSVDLTNAKELGLTIHLIDDGKPNFLYYSRDKLINFDWVFKQYINILFPIKERKIEGSKKVLNYIFGSLCEKDKIKSFISDKFKLEDDDEIVELYPSSTDEDHHIMKTVKKSKIFKSSFARLGPFLLSNSRRYMTSILLPHKDYIQRCHTDGFLTSKVIHKNTENIKLGELKYCGYTSNGVIINSINKVKTRC